VPHDKNPWSENHENNPLETGYLQVGSLNPPTPTVTVGQGPRRGKVRASRGLVQLERRPPLRLPPWDRKGPQRDTVSKNDWCCLRPPNPLLAGPPFTPPPVIAF